MYDMPTEIDVAADGPLRIITLNRPESLNSVNDALHHGLAKLWQRMSDDQSARAAVLTGAGRAFSAGGDFTYLNELAEHDSERGISAISGCMASPLGSSPLPEPSAAAAAPSPVASSGA